MMHGSEKNRLKFLGGFTRGRRRNGPDYSLPILGCGRWAITKIYLDGWLSPRRFRRSRRRRCNGVGVLGLKATKYHKGWLRSLLSQVSVGASALGWRATFSRMAA